MSKWFATAACVALALLGSYSVQTLEAQGPIREGARRTGEAIADTGRAVAEGTRRVVRGAAEVATGGRIGGRETRYDADGRRVYVDTNEFVRHDAEGRPIDADGRLIEMQEGDQLQQDLQPYESGYRGVEGQADVGPTQHQQLFYDRCGRPFICDNGRRVYVNEQEFAQHPQQYEARKPTLADEQNRLDGQPMTDRPASATDEATDYNAAPPLPEGATAPALNNSNRGIQPGNPDTGPAEPDPNPQNPGKSNVPGQQPGDNADTSTTNSAD